MLMKPEPLKGLEWLSPINNYDQRLIKNFQQIYSQKLLAAAKGVSPATMMMRCLYRNNANLSMEVVNQSSPFKPYHKAPEDYTSSEESGTDDVAKSPKANAEETLVYTILRGVSVAGFDNGGEKLLCLPQILNLMKSVDLDEINCTINTLGIVCVECDEESLEILHRHDILPKQATCCGLISLSNAERLLKFFSNTIDPQPNGFEIASKTRLPSENCCLDSSNCHQIRVTHDCFGQQKGILFPLKYTHPNSRCIDCLDCGRSMSPSDFVGHTHQDNENHWLETEVCHWGFDSTNWRWYIRLSEDSTRTKIEEDSLNEYLDEIKKRFGVQGQDFPTTKIGRPSSSVNQIAFTENHFKNLQLSGAVFQQCVARINSNALSSREEKMQLINALFNLRQEHLHQINNLITERQHLIEGMMTQSKDKSRDENRTGQLIEVIRFKTSYLKKEQNYRKRAVSCSSDIGKRKSSEKSYFPHTKNDDIQKPKKIKLDAETTIECCDSSAGNAPILDSPSAYTIIE